VLESAFRDHKHAPILHVTNETDFTFWYKHL